MVVFQEIAKGAEVSSAPRVAPSSLNWTPATPTLSEADAATGTAEPDTVAPLAGAVSKTVGGVVSVLATVTLTAAGVAGVPAAAGGSAGRRRGPAGGLLGVRRK